MGISLKLCMTCESNYQLILFYIQIIDFYAQVHLYDLMKQIVKELDAVKARHQRNVFWLVLHHHPFCQLLPDATFVRSTTNPALICRYIALVGQRAITFLRD